MMSFLDMLSWAGGGLIAGGLIGAERPGREPVQRVLVALVGLAGALAGGAVIARQSGMSAVAFLGAVCTAVLVATALAYFFWRGNAKQ